MAQPMPRRDEIAVEHTWNTESVFPDDAAWEREFEELARAIPGLERFQGHLADGPQTLVDWYETSGDLLRRVFKVAVYASMLHDADTADGDAQAKNDRATSLWGRMAAASAFADPEILAIGQWTLRTWMDQDAALRTYEHDLDALFQRSRHVRSAEVEEVLGLAGDPFATAASIHRTIADADLRFQPARTSSGDTIEVAQGNITGLRRDRDREVRRTAYEHYADAYLALKNGLAACLITGVKQNVFTARVRRYSSSLEAALAPNHIPLEVFHNLVDVFQRNLPLWHRYWRIMREGLGYDRLHAYDVRAPLSTHPSDISFERSMEWITRGLEPLGGEYVSALRRGVLEQRWVDIYPNQNKRGGAYSGGSPGTYPFILMSYSHDLESMSTLAHELGHSMHSYFTWQTQPFVYSDYSIFVAEVASNFNQALVRDYLLRENDDPDFQIAVIDEAMNNFHRYFFVMPTLARFELAIHERAERDEGLTAQSLMELMTQLFGEGFGDEVEFDADRVGIEWAQFPNHLYSNFYVYQYATGIAAAQALAGGVLSGDPAARENYLRFLKAGSSLYPLDALKLAGVDMTSREPVERGFQAMGEMIDRLPGLLERRNAATSSAT